MGKSSVCILTRTEFSRKIPFPTGTTVIPTESKVVNAVKIAGTILYDVARVGLYLVSSETKHRAYGFSMTVDDGHEIQFPYGNKQFNNDTEDSAFQKAIDKASSLGFSSDRKSISLFLNGKIQSLVMTKS